MAAVYHAPSKPSSPLRTSTVLPFLKSGADLVLPYVILGRLDFSGFDSTGDGFHCMNPVLQTEEQF